ncbi:hypothetical protein MUG87_04195 [Ectobacillus sp. JY-23]|uniref:hypothetical protein n=1 Tax=Ectobacillus sp. JY-23 TaxID=2933872 RepID=UPI001FF3F810|nr:hypothetical protein [Ectobacillus sp. JY-23]UOY93335.1 hypothetical protein MUG87_04195 [Ectobacillus sp. JY-23]
MGLQHEFFLVPDTVDAYCFSIERQVEAAIDVVYIHDDLIVYMWDTLQWIPSKTPRKTGIEEGLGLNRWGITVLDDESVEKISNILQAWRMLFKMSPHQLTLTGGLMWTENELVEYEQLKFQREEVLEQLDKLIVFTKQVQNKSYYICHWGV